MNETMKAIIVESEERLVWGDMTKPDPDVGQVRIEVVAAGVNRADILQRKGMYPPPKGAPDIMGLEVSGYIDAVGEEVEDWQIGQEVCALLPAGGYAEFAIADVGCVMPIPKGISLEAAAALPETVMTVWANVFEIAQLQANETLLIQGGGSGIGTTAIQMAKAYGAHVYVTAGSDEKCMHCCRIGADGAFNYRADDFEANMHEIGGADIVLDMVGGEYLPKHINLMKPLGRIIHIAVQGGLKAEVNLLKVMMKRLTITGSTLRSRSSEEKARIAEAVVQNIWPLVEETKVRPIIDSTFTLKDAAHAHERLTSGNHVGKIILTA